MDKIDEEKWKVKELLDNKEKDKYIYLVTIITGLRKDAGTQSKVGFSVTGEKHETGERLLCDGVTKVSGEKYFFCLNVRFRSNLEIMICNTG